MLNSPALIRQFEKNFGKVERYIVNARLRGAQLYWKNYNKWYRLHVKKARVALRQLQKLGKNNPEINNFLEKLEFPLKTIFNVKTSTDDKNQALQNFKQIWDDLCTEIERQSIAEYDIFTRRKFEVEEKLCFVLMPFSKTFKPLYSKAIKPAVRSVGLKCKRSDDIFNVRAVVQDIWEYINKARIVIADLTGRNPNVFYETGLSHALGKRVILLAQTSEDVPFDIKHIRYIPYQNTATGRKQLTKNLLKTIRSLLR